ncbi:cupin domain-containing protein [Amycolatopsis rhabdoformis]|uniref:Cupin domain-containing protein n=1 Tax=Amycolatopsis rhabdoformis TaxID=1448059 RepID=A0ABZ1II73_9PSEU|nr:cupin domain-containing protein [Amycolatopsis rhabdoformis]WSE33647.1 cupin domain-containing protein [Amycolatopsis rhabdoformis]
MRDEYQKGVLASEKKNLDSSEIAARDEFNRQHPPNKGLVVEDDLRKMELPARPWRNNRGHYFDLADYEVLSAHISELKPGNNSVRHRHTTEAYLYVVKGHGFSLINYDDEPIDVVEWQEGTLFAPPRWAWHQHFNLDGNDTARYLAIQDTGLLRTMRLHNIERHGVQLSPEEGKKILDAAAEAGTTHGARK